MKSVFSHIRSHLLSGADLGEPIGDKNESLDDLQKSEWCQEFEQLMRARLIMGRFRYGRMDRTTDTNYDRIGSALQRLKMYRTTGNLEHLVDVANLCMMEFLHSDHPDKHFAAADDGIHAERT